MYKRLVGITRVEIKILYRFFDYPKLAHNCVNPCVCKHIFIWYIWYRRLRLAGDSYLVALSSRSQTHHYFVCIQFLKSFIVMLPNAIKYDIQSVKDIRNNSSLNRLEDIIKIHYLQYRY